jgi:hypothetical protein
MMPIDRAAAVPTMTEANRFPKSTAPTGSQTPINTALATEAPIVYDASDEAGWALVTPSMGYATPYFATYNHVKAFFKQDRNVSANVIIL